MPDKSEADTAEFVPLLAAGAAECPREFSSLVHVEVGSLTHPGKVRPNNEDHFLVTRFGRSLETLQTNLAEHQVPDRFDEIGYGFAVADGMGGAAAGEVASSLAITTAVNMALNTPKWNLLINPQEIRENMEKWRRRFRQIDQLLTERALADPALSGMGTTMTVALSVGTDLLLYHVGDSRAYLFRQGKLHQLTRDHTAAQALADAGLITPTAVAGHCMRHVLTKALGGQGGDIEAEIQHLHLAEGDRLLLCTDGLNEMVPDTGIAEVLRRIAPSAEASRALVDLALEGGGKDNVTVVLARYSLHEGAREAPEPGRGK